LVNLLSNAADASKGRKGSVVEVQVTVGGDDIEFAVKDEGTGLSPENRSRIFDAFFTTKPRGQGTGLGLSISRALAEAHDGELRLDEHSDGTRFVLRLPLAGRSPTKAPPIKVLLADDDQEV